MPDEPRFELVNMDDIIPQPVSWLWPGRVPVGKLTLLTGDPGRGKGFVFLDIAARLSRGAAWPDGGEAPVGRTVLLTAEDDLGDAVAPRLAAAGAFQERVFVLQSKAAVAAKTRLLRLKDDLPVLEEAIRRKDARLVGIDPLGAYLVGVKDSETELRGVLDPLSQLAGRTGAAVVAIRHLNKGKADEPRSALDRVLGSVAYGAAARAVLLVCFDPEDDDEPDLNKRRRLLLPVKYNLKANWSGHGFHIRDRWVHVEGREIEAGSVEWDAEPVGATADDAVAPPVRRASKREAAEALLRECLRDGPMLASEIERKAEERKISESTLDRAKARLRVESSPDMDEATKRVRGWLWSLPAAGSPAV